MFSKSKRLPFVEGLSHGAARRESHRTDTDSRLLTETNRSQDVTGAVAPDLQSLSSGDVSKPYRGVPNPPNKGVQ